MISLPVGLRYRFSDAFSLILEAVDELGVRVVALDSLGMALEGDALKGAVVIDFFRDRIDQPARCLGPDSGPPERLEARRVLSEQGAVRLGLQRLSVSISAAARTRTNAMKGTRVIVRQNKTNFGAPQVPFVVQTLFEEEKIVLSREALSEEDLREESVLNATDRVLLSLWTAPPIRLISRRRPSLAGWATSSPSSSVKSWSS